MNRMLISILFLLPHLAFANVQIIDDIEFGANFVGAWQSGSYHPDVYNRTYTFTSKNLGAEVDKRTATWTFPISQSGLYGVYAAISPNIAGLTEDAIYEVIAGNKVYQFIVDQKNARTNFNDSDDIVTFGIDNDWVFLGAIFVKEGVTEIRVLLSNNFSTGSLVMADAIRIERGIGGVEGPKGEKGDTGPAGEVGPRGQRGFEGEQGQTGPRGEKGDKGEKGEPGPAGPEGPKGDRGNPGTPGMSGPAGLNSYIIQEELNPGDDPTCPSGGVRIISFLDLNRNNEFNDSDPSQTTTLCHGKTNPAPTPPEARSFTTTITKNTVGRFELFGQDTVGNDSIIDYFITEEPLHGTVSRIGSLVTYRPKLGFTGVDRLTYRVLDSNNEISDPATVTINIEREMDLLITVTMVVDYASDANKTLGEKDLWFKDAMEAREFDVLIVDDDEIKTNNSDAFERVNRGSFIFISESVNSSEINTKLNDLEKPIIVTEKNLWDDFNMSQGEVKQAANRKSIVILNDGHTITQGLSGTKNVLAGNGKISGANVHSNALKLAKIGGGESGHNGATVFVYEPGSTGFNNQTSLQNDTVQMAGLRIGLFPYEQELSEIGKSIYLQTVDFVIEAL